MKLLPGMPVIAHINDIKCDTYNNQKFTINEIKEEQQMFH